FFTINDTPPHLLRKTIPPGSLGRTGRGVWPGQSPSLVQGLPPADARPPLRGDHVMHRGPVAVAFGEGLYGRPDLARRPVLLQLLRREESPDASVVEDHDAARVELLQPAGEPRDGRDDPGVRKHLANDLERARGPGRRGADDRLVA